MAYVRHMVSKSFLIFVSTKIRISAIEIDQCQSWHANSGEARFPAASPGEAQLSAANVGVANSGIRPHALPCN